MFSPRARRGGVLLFVGGLFMQSLSAQSTFAFLVTQPRLEEGIALLPANRIDCYAASYSIEGREISVYLTFEVEPLSSIFDPSSWDEFPCSVGQESLRRNPGERVVYGERPRYRLFLSAEQEEDISLLCGFVTAFTGTFEFFLDTLSPSIGDAIPPEFPAVVGIPAR